MFFRIFYKAFSPHLSPRSLPSDATTPELALVMFTELLRAIGRALLPPKNNAFRQSSGFKKTAQ